MTTSTWPADAAAAAPPKLPINLGPAPEAAAIIRCHVKTLHKLRRQGLLRGYWFGGMLRYDLDEVRALASPTRVKFDR